MINSEKKEPYLNNIYCSRKCQDFYLIYDGLGTYYCYYKEELLLELAEPLNPKELHKKHWNDILSGTYKQLQETSTNNLIDNLLKIIIEIIGDKPTNNHKIKTILTDLVRTIKDAETDKHTNNKHFSEVPQIIIDKAIKISKSKGYDAEAFDKLLTPMNIIETMEQRSKPRLTSEQKIKADIIAKQINNKGLLAYLDNILNKIHIGEHKNIYRKTLAVFKIMRGEASFISETTAKAEQRKSFEDEIIYSLITPKSYVMEVNLITEASFVRMCYNNPKYYNRMILYFGDLGAKKSFAKVEPILNIVKPLITEGKYNYIKSNTDTDVDIIEIPMEVDSIGAVYQTTKNSFTEEDDQLKSRTIYSTPTKVETERIAKQIYYLRNSKTKQSKAKTEAEQELRDFGLYLMQMVNSNIEIINPYFDVFWEYASKSENPIREFKQQLELFDAYCILTQDKCREEPKGTIFASEEQLKEFMDYINLENTLIPYEYNFLDMLLAKGTKKELTILYNDFDLVDDEGNTIEDINLNEITTLTECENGALEVINTQLRQKLRNKLKSQGYNRNEIEENLNEYKPIETKADLSTSQLKELPRKLLSKYGFRGSGINHEANIFFRYSDLKNYYGKRPAYKNIENIPQLLQTLYKKGYLGKYEYKQGKENLYYLTPMADNLTSDFKLKKSYDRYVSDYFADADYDNF